MSCTSRDSSEEYFSYLRRLFPHGRIEKNLRHTGESAVHLEAFYLVKNALRPVDGEGRYQYLAPGVYRSGQRFPELRPRGFEAFMVPVAVGGFDHGVVGFLYKGVLPFEHRVPRAEVAGKDDFNLSSLISEPQLGYGGADDMPRVAEPNAHPVRDGGTFVVPDVAQAL
jgi:hypothetical protein